MRSRHLVVSLIATAVLAGCGKGNDEEPVEDVAADKANNESGASMSDQSMSDQLKAGESAIFEIAPGLNARIMKTGYGRAAVAGDYADTNVWLWLYDEAAEDHHGEFIWESGNDIFQFQLGAGQVIKGWDMGVPGMIEGETRELVIAGDLAYGPSGRGNIPPNATLIFTIELLKLTSSD